MSQPVRLRFADFVLDPAERSLSKHGQAVPLAPKAFDVLALLASRPGRLVTKEELLAEVWPNAFVEESNLAYQVHALRRALGEQSDGQRFFETVPKRGYRFIAPVGPADIQIPLDDSRHEATPIHEPAGAVSGDRHRWRHAAALWFVVGAVTALVAVLVSYRARPVEVRAPTRVELFTNVRLADAVAFAISPDGRQLAFAGAGADGVRRLWIRSLAEDEARPLPGTEIGAGGPFPPMFWSPDSRFVAFDRLGELKKVDLTGGLPQTVCRLPALAVGGSWSRDDVIVVGSPQGGIFRCPAGGGEAAVVTQVDASRAETAHLFPWFLPDGRHFLYLGVSRDQPEQSGVFLSALDEPAPNLPRRRIIATGFGASFVSQGRADRGHLLFVREGRLVAQALNLTNFQTEGEVRQIAEPVGSFLDGAFFSASAGGTVVFRRPAKPLRLTWVDRQGTVLGRVGEQGHFSGLALSPDGRRAVVAKRSSRDTIDQDLWLLDLDSGRSQRVTFDAALEAAPVWSPDGGRLTFTHNGTIGSLFEQVVGDEASPRVLLETAQHKVPTSISRDGRFLAFSTATIGASRVDIWAKPLLGFAAPFPVVQQAFDQHSAQFSPDGKWLAYVSNESGRQEVLVRAFLPDGIAESEPLESIVVSTSGGAAPRWSADGGTLFYLTPDDAVAAAAVDTGPPLRVGQPVVLFRVPGLAWDWSPSRDGQRFLILAPEPSPPVGAFSLIFDWPRLLQ